MSLHLHGIFLFLLIEYSITFLRKKYRISCIYIHDIYIYTYTFICIRIEIYTYIVWQVQLLNNDSAYAL